MRNLLPGGLPFMEMLFWGMNSMDKPGFMGRTLLWLVPGWSQGRICSWSWVLEKREVMEGTFLASGCHHGMSWHGFGNLWVSLVRLGQQERDTEDPAQQNPWDPSNFGIRGMQKNSLWRCSPSSSRVLCGCVFPLEKPRGLDGNCLGRDFDGIEFPSPALPLWREHSRASAPRP